MFGSEKNTNTVQAKAPVKIITTTTTTKIAKATTTTTVVVSTTTKPILEEVKIVNAIIDNSVKNNIKTEDKTLLKNIKSTIYVQGEDKNKTLALGVEVLKGTINTKTTKAVNGGVGLGLLFLGIFGIINITSQNDLAIGFRKNLLIRNAFVLVIGLGFLLNNLGTLITKIKIPTI